MVTYLEDQGVTELNEASPKHLTLFLAHEWERPRLRARRDGDSADDGRISTEVIVRTYEIMRTFWKWVVASGYISLNPMETVRKPAKPEMLNRVLPTGCASQHRRHPLRALHNDPRFTHPGHLRDNIRRKRGC